jgi:integrase
MASVKWDQYEKGIWRRKSERSETGWLYRAVRQGGKRDGRYTQEVKHCQRLDEARDFRKGAAAPTHTVPEKARWTLQQAYEAMHADPDTEYAPATIVWHDDLWRALPDSLKAKRLKDISTDALRQELAKLTARTMRDRVRILVGGVYKYAGMADVSPATKPYVASTRARRMRDDRAGKIEGRYRTDDEVLAIIRATPERYRPMLNLMWRCGLRPGELFALTVGQLDPESHRLTVDRAVNDRTQGPTKTGRVRTFVLPLAIFDQLSAYIRSEAGWTDPEGFVFTTERGTMIDADNFRRRVFAPAAKAAGVNHGVTLMDLRHTAASNMVAAGIDLATVAQHTGHSLRVLWNTYTHAVDTALDRAATTMDSVIRA